MALRDDWDKNTSQLLEIIKKDFEDENLKMLLLEEINKKSHYLATFLLACL